MSENETVEHLVGAIQDALEDATSEVECDPRHLVIAATAVAVQLCWASAKDRSQVREILAGLVDDFATQSENGAPMVTQ